MAPLALDVRYKTDAARVVLVRRVVQTLLFRKMNERLFSVHNVDLEIVALFIGCDDRRRETGDRKQSNVDLKTRLSV